MEEDQMKKFLIAVLALAALTGCATGVKKTFTVATEPPDAVIRVVSGEGLGEKKYASPAEISVRIPVHSGLAAKNVMEVSHEAYKPKKIALRSIRDGEKLMVKLDKIVRYGLAGRMLGPLPSKDLRFQDQVISVSFEVTEQGFLMNLTNLTSYELKILWNQAEYTDTSNRARRLMHSGIRYEDRNNALPPQSVPARGSLQQKMMPVSSVVYSEEKKGYEVQPAFPLDTDAAQALKGKVFYLFLPMEYNRQIIPYNFKIEISDVVKK
jgi:hypothetical protein